MSWNLARGSQLDGIVEFLASADADIIFLQEADRDARRTNYRNVAREMAQTLKIHYVFANSKNWRKVPGQLLLTMVDDEGVDISSKHVPHPRMLHFAAGIDATDLRSEPDQLSSRNHAQLDYAGTDLSKYVLPRLDKVKARADSGPVSVAETRTGSWPWSFCFFRSRGIVLQAFQLPLNREQTRLVAVYLLEHLTRVRVSRNHGFGGTNGRFYKRDRLGHYGRSHRVRKPPHSLPGEPQKFERRVCLLELGIANEFFNGSDLRAGVAGRR